MVYHEGARTALQENRTLIDIVYISTEEAGSCSPLFYAFLSEHSNKGRTFAFYNKLWQKKNTIT